MSSRSQMPRYILVLTVGLALAGYVFYAYVLSPISREAADLSQRLDIVSRRIGSIAQKGETLASLRAEYEEALKALQAIDSIVTRETGIPYFLRDLDRVSSASGVAVVSLSIGSLASSSPYAEVPFTIEVQGSYQQVKTFLDKLLSLGRAMSVRGVRLAAPRGTSDAGGAQTLDAALSMVLYVVPKGGGGR